jgi:hypothetical protein
VRVYSVKREHLVHRQILAGVRRVGGEDKKWGRSSIDMPMSIELRTATHDILVKNPRQNSQRITRMPTHRFALRHNSMKAPRHNPMKITWFAVVQF